MFTEEEVRVVEAVAAVEGEAVAEEVVAVAVGAVEAN